MTHPVSSSAAAPSPLFPNQERRKIQATRNSITATFAQADMENPCNAALQQWTEEVQLLLTDRTTCEESFTKKMEELRDLLRTQGVDTLVEFLEQYPSEPPPPEKPRMMTMEQLKAREDKTQLDDLRQRLATEEADAMAAFENALQSATISGIETKTTLEENRAAFTQSIQEMRATALSATKAAELIVQARKELAEETKKLSQEYAQLKKSCQEHQSSQAELQQAKAQLDGKLTELEQRAQEVIDRPPIIIHEKTKPFEEVCKVVLPVIAAITAAYFVPGLSASAGPNFFKFGISFAL